MSVCVRMSVCMYACAFVLVCICVFSLCLHTVLQPMSTDQLMQKDIGQAKKKPDFGASVWEGVSGLVPEM